MKTPALMALALLTGCAATNQTAQSVANIVRPQRSPEEVAARAEAVRNKEATRRFAICMKQTLGPFSGFASPSSRQQAAETCQRMMEPPSSTTAATNP